MQFHSPQNGIECAINDSLIRYKADISKNTYTFGKLFTYKYIDHYESDKEFNVYVECMFLKNIYSDDDIQIYEKNTEVNKIIVNMLNGTFTINNDKNIFNII